MSDMFLWTSIVANFRLDLLCVSPCLEPDGRHGDKAGSLFGLETTHLVHGRELFVVQALKVNKQRTGLMTKLG